MPAQVVEQPLYEVCNSSSGEQPRYLEAPFTPARDNEYAKSLIVNKARVEARYQNVRRNHHDTLWVYTPQRVFAADHYTPPADDAPPDTPGTTTPIAWGLTIPVANTCCVVGWTSTLPFTCVTIESVVVSPTSVVVTTRERHYWEGYESEISMCGGAFLLGLGLAGIEDVDFQTIEVVDNYTVELSSPASTGAEAALVTYAGAHNGNAGSLLCMPPYSIAALTCFMRRSVALATNLATEQCNALECRPTRIPLTIEQTDTIVLLNVQGRGIFVPSPVLGALLGVGRVACATDPLDARPTGYLMRTVSCGCYDCDTLAETIEGLTTPVVVSDDDHTLIELAWQSPTSGTRETAAIALPMGTYYGDMVARQYEQSSIDAVTTAPIQPISFAFDGKSIVISTPVVSDLTVSIAGSHHIFDSPGAAGVTVARSGGAVRLPLRRALTELSMPASSSVVPGGRVASDGLRFVPVHGDEDEAGACGCLCTYRVSNWQRTRPPIGGAIIVTTGDRLDLTTSEPHGVYLGQTVHITFNEPEPQTGVFEVIDVPTPDTFAVLKRPREPTPPLLTFTVSFSLPRHPLRQRLFTRPPRRCDTGAPVHPLARVCGSDTSPPSGDDNLVAVVDLSSATQRPDYVRLRAVSTSGGRGSVRAGDYRRYTGSSYALCTMVYTETTASGSRVYELVPGPNAPVIELGHMRSTSTLQVAWPDGSAVLADCGHAFVQFSVFVRGMHDPWTRPRDPHYDYGDGAQICG